MARVESYVSSSVREITGRSREDHGEITRLHVDVGSADRAKVLHLRLHVRHHVLRHADRRHLIEAQTGKG